MPDRHYYTEHYPPRLRDHYFAHFGTVVTAGWSVVFGLLLIFAYYIPGYAGYIGTIDVDALEILRVLQGIVIIAGNVLIIKGLFVRLSKKNKQLMNIYWKFLLLGFILAGAGWASHMFLILAVSPLSLVGLSIAIAQLIFAVTGYFVTRKTQKNMEKVVAHYKKVRGELS